jgi:hypothetical protein
VTGTPQLSKFGPAAKKVLEALEGEDFVLDREVAEALRMKGGV